MPPSRWDCSQNRWKRSSDRGHSENLLHARSSYISGYARVRNLILKRAMHSHEEYCDSRGRHEQRRNENTLVSNAHSVARAITMELEIYLNIYIEDWHAVTSDCVCGRIGIIPRIRFKIKLDLIRRFQVAFYAIFPRSSCFFFFFWSPWYNFDWLCNDYETLRCKSIIDIMNEIRDNFNMGYMPSINEKFLLKKYWNVIASLIINSN